MKVKRIKHLIEAIDLLDGNIRQLREDDNEDKRDLAEQWELMKADHEMELKTLQN